MRAFSTRIHAVLDFMLALLLIALPWITGEVGRDAATWVPVAVGGALILYSLTTDYELGVVRWLQVPVHLWLDALSGLFVAISPWLFGFDQRVWMPHVAAGLVLIGVAFVSDTIPGYERRREARTGTG